jgi:hypothetical protein
MTLSSWDNLPLQIQRNVRKLYEHIQDNVSAELDDWVDLTVKQRRNKIVLWEYLATELDLPSWDDLTYKQKISRKLRYTLLYTEQTDDKHNIKFTVTDGENPVSGATVTIGTKTATTGAAGGCTIKYVTDGTHTVAVTADGFEDYSDSITTGETTSFTITLTAETPDADDTEDEQTGGE